MTDEEAKAAIVAAVEIGDELDLLASDPAENAPGDGRPGRAT